MDISHHADEPAQKSMGGYKGERHPEVVRDITGMLEHGVSFMAVDAAGQVVGIRISFVVDRWSLHDFFYFDTVLLQYTQSTGPFAIPSI